MRTVASHLPIAMFTCSLLLRSDARALFEQVTTTFPPERARPLWERWACYEYQYGDLEAARKLEKRIAEVYPSGMYARCFNQDMKLTVLSRSIHQMICSATPRTLELIPLQREISVFRWRLVSLPLQSAHLLLRSVQTLFCF